MGESDDNDELVGLLLIFDFPYNNGFTSNITAGCGPSTLGNTGEASAH